MKKTCVLFCLCLSYLFTSAQIGNLDRSFGENGIKETKFIAKESLVSETGETFGVEAINSSYNPTVRVYKYSANGMYDLSYGTNGFTELVQMTYFASEIQDDGKIVVVGSVRSPYGPIHDQIKIVRFNTNGSIEITYTSPSIGTYYNFPVKLIKQGNNIVLFEYSASAANGTNMDLIYTLSTSSNVSGPFYISPMRKNSSSGRLGLNLNTTSLSKNVAIEGNQMIIAGLEIIEGETFPYSVTTGYYVSKYVNNLPDQSFGVNGKIQETLLPDNYEHMLPVENGKFVIANSVTNESTGNRDFYISRFNKNGSADPTFNGNGIQTTDFGSSDSAYLLAIQDDKLIVAGSTQNKITGSKEFAFARYNDNGTIDEAFDTDGKQTLGKEGYSYILQQIKVEDNRLLLSGTTLSKTGETSKLVAAYLLKENVTLTCPPVTSVSTDKGFCSAVVTNIDATITPSPANTLLNYTLSGATTATGSGSVSGKTFNKGETIVSYQLANDALKTCSFSITVQDKEAPVITGISASPNFILIANHQMKDVQINYDINDNCGTINTVITVSSNEPESGTDKHDLPNDWKIIDPHHVQLRAEHAEKGNGRVYTIQISATDAAGNKSEQQVKVSVPNSISEIKKAMTGLIVKLLTNPTIDIFTLSIQSNSNDPVALRVFDMLGRVVETKSRVPANGTLQIGATYRPGTYYAEVTQGNKKETVTMIKN